MFKSIAIGASNSNGLYSFWTLKEFRHEMRYRRIKMAPGMLTVFVDTVENPYTTNAWLSHNELSRCIPRNLCVN